MKWKTLQLVSLSPFQFALISWMKRPVFDVFDCLFVPDCFLLQISLFLCCSRRRSPADFLERLAKRSGSTVTNSLATSSRAGCQCRKTPTEYALAWRERSRIFLSLSHSLWDEPQLLPFSRHVAEQTGNKNKNEPNKSILCCRSLSTTVSFPKMIDGISLRFCFDLSFERLFRNQFSELATRPQHSVQKLPSDGMQNLRILAALCNLANAGSRSRSFF